MTLERCSGGTRSVLGREAACVPESPARGPAPDGTFSRLFRFRHPPRMSDLP
jgi:hypothetical protein